MFRRAPWWSIIVALAAVTALLRPVWHTYDNSELSGYGSGLERPAAGLRLAVADAAAQVEPATVLINTDLSYQGAVGAGTGILVSPNGLVLTNNHVVEGATQISVTSVANGTTYPGTVIGYDRKNDIAVVQLQGAAGLPTAPLGNSTQVVVGDPVLVVGNAGGQGLRRTRGTVQELGQTIVASDELAAPEQLTGMIEVSANLVPGDSGGPLVNGNGQVIGVDTATSGGYRLSHRGGGEGFAIPINTALAISSQIQSGARSGSVHIGPTALLGIGTTNTRGHRGITVAQVLQGSPADQAGITAGDLITGFAGSPVPADTALTDLIDQQYPGNTVPVTWMDQSGLQHTANVTLATGPVG